MPATSTPGAVADVGTPAPTSSGGTRSGPITPLALLTPPTVAVGALCILIPLAILWAAFTMFGGAGAAVAGSAAGPNVLPGDAPAIDEPPPPPPDPPAESPP